MLKLPYRFTLSFHVDFQVGVHNLCMFKRWQRIKNPPPGCAYILNIIQNYVMHSFKIFYKPRSMRNFNVVSSRLTQLLYGAISSAMFVS